MAVADGLYRDPVSGQVVRVVGGQVQLSKGGQVHAFAPEEAGGAIVAGGFAPASAEEVAKKDAPALGAGDAAKAFVEKAATGVYGGATALPRGLGALAEGMAKDAGVPMSGPSVSALGEEALARGVATGLGGTKEAEEYMAARARRGDSLPAALGSIVGQTAGALAAPGISQLAGEAAPAAARVAAGALEGAGFGGSAAAEQAYVTNTDLSGEKVIAAMGPMAALGGGASLLGVGASRLFSRQGSRAAASVDSPVLGQTKKAGPEGFAEALGAGTKEDAAYAAVAKEALGGVEPAPGLGKAVREAVEDIAKQDSATAAVNAKRAAVRGPEPPKTMWEKAGVWRRRAELLDKNTRDVTDSLDVLVKDRSDIFEEVVNSSLKRSHVRGKIEGDPAAMLAAARQEGARVRAELQAIRLDAETFGNASLIKKTTNYTSKLIDEIDRAADPADAFIALDKLKRGLQRDRIHLGRSALRLTSADDIGKTQALGQAFENLQEGTRTLLMHEGTWGPAAADQRGINAAWEQWFASKQLFERNILSQVGETFDGRAIQRADPDKIANYIDKLGRERGALIDEQVRAHVAATRGLADAIDTAYDLGAKRETVAGIRSAADRVAASLTSADKTIRVANQVQAVLDAESAASKLSGMLGPSIGAVIAGPFGAAAGAAAGFASRPAQQIRLAAAMQSLGDSVDGRILAAVRSVLRPVESGAGRATQAVGKGAVGKVPARTMALSAFTQGDETPRQAFVRHAREVYRANDPVQATQAMGRNLDPLYSHAPQTAQAATATVNRAAAYLATKLPAKAVEVNIFSPTKQETNISDHDLHKFATAWATVNDPLSMLDDMERGMLTQEQVEAVRVVYPELYRHIQQKTLEALGKQKTPPPYDMRTQLDLMLGLNGAGEPSLAPAFQRTLAAIGQAVEAAAQKPQPGPSGQPSQLAKSHQTLSQKVAL